MTGPIATKPPLTVWIAAVMAAVALLLALGNLHRTPWLATSAYRSERFNLRRLREVAPDALHIVALGTSKTMYAMDFDDAFAARIASSGRRVVFHRLTASDPEFGDMRPALAAIAQRPPKVLLVESELLLFDRSDRALLDVMLKRSRQNVLMLANLVSGLVHRELSNNRGLEEWTIQSRCLQSETADVLDTYADHAARWRMTTDAERLAWLVYLRRMRAAGTRVVLLAVPRAPSADGAVPADLKRQGALLREELLAHEGFIGWDPGAMAESLYCDQVHVNRRGRAFYSAWLAKQLAALLGARPGV